VKEEMIKVFIICGHQSPRIHKNIAFRKGKGEWEYCSVLNVGTQNSKNKLYAFLSHLIFFIIRTMVLMLSLIKLLSSL